MKKIKNLEELKQFLGDMFINDFDGEEQHKNKFITCVIDYLFGCILLCEEDEYEQGMITNKYEQQLLCYIDGLLVSFGEIGLTN